MYVKLGIRDPIRDSAEEDGMEARALKDINCTRSVATGIYRTIAPIYKLCKTRSPIT